jgi:hypothetical protein
MLAQPAMREPGKLERLLTAARHPGLAARRWRAASPSTRDPRLIAYVVRTRGLRGALGQRRLGDDFFQKHVAFEQGYAALARLILGWASPESACDMGCGNGYIVSSLATHGVHAEGVDSSPSVLRFVDPAIRDRISICDLSRPQRFRRFDLVISTEVAEHLPKRAARTFVGNVARHADRRVFFTAAHPGQWGDGHINCQPRDYWIALFHEQGLLYDAQASDALGRAAAASAPIMESVPWLVENIMAFTRVAPNAPESG